MNGTIKPTPRPLILFLSLVCWNLFGQGTVHFGGDRSTGITNGLTGQPVSAADGIKAALYWCPLISDKLAQLGPPVNVGIPLPGLFFGGTRLTGAETPGGGRARFQVRAWESASGATYEEAMGAPARNGRGALIGESAVLEVPTGNANPPTPPAVLTAYGLTGFQLTPASAPLLECPADFSTNQPVVTFPVPAGRGSPPATVICAPPSGSTLPVGTNVITCIAANSLGTNQCSFQVTIREPPYSPLGYRFMFSGEPHRQYLTEFSTNLIDWLPLQTNQLERTELEMLDRAATNSSMRFYRTRPLP